MIEDTELIEYRLKPIDTERIISSEEGETAYELESVQHGSCVDRSEEIEKLKQLKALPCSLGFESDTECDFAPYVLKTYNADKTVNTQYNYGEHQPGGKCYSEPCKFQVGDKVLCLIHEGYDAVFPAIVVGPLTKEYLRNLYETDTEMQIGYSSADDAVERWSDWDWDSVIVRPLVRLRNDWEEMGETVMVRRVYLFPYKKFDIKNLVFEKLREWRESHNIPEGSYKAKSYGHIMDLSPYNKHKRRNAIAETLEKFEVLTDGVKYFRNVLPVNELHPYANHLNSSQILCYNFFGKLLAINDTSKRIVGISSDMREWLRTHLPKVPLLSESACCKFEAVVDPKEGTSFDFIVYDDKTEIRFEIKYTEDGFGKSKKDSTSKSGISHHQKYLEIYQPRIEGSTVVKKPDDEDEFFSYYQLFRNAICGNGSGPDRRIYNVFIFPVWNMKCVREFNNFIEKYVEDRSRVISLHWNKIVPADMKGLLGKYYF